MVSPTEPPSLRRIVRRLKDKGQALRRGGPHSSNAHQIRLLPQEGWQQRNYRFLRNIVIPSIFAQRVGMPSLDLVAARSLDQVTWIGHATYLIQIDGINILVDPNWALWHGFFKRVRSPGLLLDHLPPIDLVLVTHAHHDHLHLRSLEGVARGQPILLPAGVSRVVRRQTVSPVEMEWWQDYHFRDLRIVFTPARHWGARFVHDVHRGFGGFVIEGKRHTVFHCGDSAAFEEFSEIWNRHAIDLALMPIGAYDAPSGREVHMSPEEAIEAFLELRARHMCPMHYGSFPLGGEPMHEPLKRLIHHAGGRQLSHRVHILPEGTSLSLGQFDPGESGDDGSS